MHIPQPSCRSCNVPPSRRRLPGFGVSRSYCDYPFIISAGPTIARHRSALATCITKLPCIRRAAAAPRQHLPRHAGSSENPFDRCPFPSQYMGSMNEAVQLSTDQDRVTFSRPRRDSDPASRPGAARPRAHAALALRRRAPGSVRPLLEPPLSFGPLPA